MGPIWPSYFKDCSSVIVCFYTMYLDHLTFTFRFLYDYFVCVLQQFVVDSVNIAQIASSCIQLLTVLSAEALRSVSILILFNKR